MFWGRIYFRGPRGYTINLWLCCGGVADDAVMPIRAESSSWLSWWGSGVN